MSRAPYDEYTLAIHGGIVPDPTTGAILTPIFQSTTFVREGLGPEPEFSYSRSANPTVSALERNLGAQEHTLDACCFSTGMAALTTLFLATLKRGDRVLASDVVYGGTFRLLREILAPFGVESDFIDTSSPAEVERALQRPARLLVLESPANPTLKLTDIAACAALARQQGVTIVVDNTFLTPVLQRPIELGADVVLYSTTKYQDGHNATLGGAICTRDADLLERIRYVRQAVGTIQTPFNAWLTLQGLKTLPLRMERHSTNALEVARFLESQAEVQSVRYPWLESFPQYTLARGQQRSGGGIVAFELHGGIEAAREFLASLRLVRLAENLGSAETLATHPASMTHASVPRETRLAIGLEDGLIRLSVGLEDPHRIIEDLSHALRSEAAA